VTDANNLSTLTISEVLELAPTQASWVVISSEKASIKLADGRTGSIAWDSDSSSWHYWLCGNDQAEEESGELSTADDLLNIFGDGVETNEPSTRTPRDGVAIVSSLYGEGVILDIDAPTDVTDQVLQAGKAKLSGLPDGVWLVEVRLVEVRQDDGRLTEQVQLSAYRQPTATEWRRYWEGHFPWVDDAEPARPV
jgi:hypothetical protein